MHAALRIRVAKLVLVGWARCAHPTFLSIGGVADVVLPGVTERLRLAVNLAVAVTILVRVDPAVVTAPPTILFVGADVLSRRACFLGVAHRLSMLC
jgi:hypothetical protein